MFVAVHNNARPCSVLMLFIKQLITIIMVHILLSILRVLLSKSKLNTMKQKTLCMYQIPATAEIIFYHLDLFTFFLTFNMPLEITCLLAQSVKGVE